MEDRERIVWRTANGVNKPIAKLSNNHLLNIIKKFETLRISEEMKDLLLTEYVYRVNNSIIVTEEKSSNRRFSLSN